MVLPRGLCLQYQFIFLPFFESLWYTFLKCLDFMRINIIIFISRKWFEDSGRGADWKVGPNTSLALILIQYCVIVIVRNSVRELAIARTFDSWGIGLMLYWCVISEHLFIPIKSFKVNKFISFTYECDTYIESPAYWRSVCIIELFALLALARI